MKRIIFLTIALTMACSVSCLAATPTPEAGSIAATPIIEESVPTAPPELGSIVGMPDNMLYKTRGCCSHHNGVCGCNNGRAVCCDNTYSPSCGC